MKPIERIVMYLQFRSINPHSFERKIHLSNGYLSKQLKNLGSVGTDILLKMHDHYPELNLLWVLTGEGDMIGDPLAKETIPNPIVDEFAVQYVSENKKLKGLESNLAQLSTHIKDKDKIIGLYEFMLNNQNHAGSIGDSF